MKLKFSPNDFNQRLNESWVMFRGHPVYLKVEGRNISGSFNCKEYFLIEDHGELDISSVQLGYVNKADSVYYVRRIPTQRYKQGVCSSNIQSESLVDMRSSRGMNVTSNAFINMLNNKYPPIQAVLKDSSCRSVAVSRDIAIRTNNLGVKSVYYKQELVGWMAPKSNTVNVPNSEMATIVSYYLGELNWEIN